MFEKEDNTLIPKKLHAIWLGGILKDEGKKNIADWKTKNPDYEANIWIDSSTYLDDDSIEGINQKEEYAKFKEWAQKIDVNIIDINPKSTESDPSIIKRPELFEKMKSAKYYLDELTNPGSNYAAASDILRAEILYHEGGVYFDAEDVFANQTLGQLEAEKGILVHSYSRWGMNLINNDLIAGVPKGKMIGELRDLIQNNYNELYSKEKKHLIAHRFANLCSFRTEDRKSSTIRISGPNALKKILNLNDTRKGLAKILNEFDPQIVFSSKYWLIPDNQALSWLDSDFSSIEKVSPYFRLNLIEYFNVLIDDFNLSSTDETKTLLKRLQDAINSQSPSMSMIELLNYVKQLFTQQELQQIDSLTNNLFSTFESHSNQAEEFLLYCKHGNVSPKDLYRFIKGRSGCYEEAEPITLNVRGLYNILHFFHEEFSKGFFEIIKLTEVPAIKLHSPWKYSFSDEQQKQLTEQVTEDMIKLRQETSIDALMTSEQKKTERTDEKINKAGAPATLENQNQQSYQQEKISSPSQRQESRSKIFLNITYPFGKNGPGRSHMAPATYDGKFKNFKGDKLKRKILEQFKDEIEQCSSVKQLNSVIKSITTSEEFEVLKTPQRITSAILGLKTTAIESLEVMLNDAVTQIMQKNKFNNLQDEDLISLDEEVGNFAAKKR